MGKIYNLTCRNKDCGYHIEIREGCGMKLFSYKMTLEENIKSGEEDAPKEIKELLDQGLHIEIAATFLCPLCKEYINTKEPYILEKIHVSPYGTIREYKMHYIYNEPKCDKCGTKLIHILNPRSSKNKCPKCGCGEMRYGQPGFYD